MKAVIVIPTIRENSIQQFLEAWKDDFTSHHIIVVEDNPSRTFILPQLVEHVSWKDVDEDLGADSWIIPRRSGAIRNYGILKAARLNPDMIVMLDDDCLPNDQYHHGRVRGKFLQRHWKALETPGTIAPFFNTMQTSGTGLMARGFPRELQRAKTVLNHGLWNNIPDLDGQTQLKNPDVRTSFPEHSVQVPLGVMFPLSAMNVAFRPELLPAMYQLPMGQGQPFHRFDDIWCGWIMKKACDAAFWSVRSGSPAIFHARASDAKRNAELEAPGILENEKVWRRVDSMGLVSTILSDALTEIHYKLKPLGPYWAKAAEASAIWRRLVS